MTKEQFIEKYTGKAVWCKTEELAEEFLKEADSFGFEWFVGDKPTEYSNFNTYKYETCYFVGKIVFTITYGSLRYAKNNGYEIIEYKPNE